MRKVIYDIEANSLTPTRIWCVVAKDINTDEVFTFLEDDKDKFVKFCSPSGWTVIRSCEGFSNCGAKFIFFPGHP